ncbi:MAG: hypothetical protein KKD28_15950 [Chloroflexi bacterium]|nr:hypothetical protein [Chloroflexota bacterium]
MKYFVVEYYGEFGFIKPWTAVRDGETFSQQFLTPSIIEGMRQKLEVSEIIRHKLSYASIDIQQEKVHARAWKKSRQKYSRENSILKRGVMIKPKLILAFSSWEDAEKASRQHLCLCRNEDILLPKPEIIELTDEEFDKIVGFELRFGKIEQSFLVGYNRFDNNQPMFGWIEITGKPTHHFKYE